MYKAIAVCGRGMGTSLVLRMSAEKAIKEMGVAHLLEVEHMDLGSAKSMPCDFYIITEDMRDTFEREHRRFVSVKTAFDANALKSGLSEMVKELDEEKEGARR